MPADVFSAAPGTVLGEKYRVVERLDAGGMGVVYAAQEIATGREVALKVIKSKLAHDEDVRERFRREREILGRLDHPAVVRVYGSGELPGKHLYLEMELLRGETLKDRLRRTGPFPARAFVPILQWIASAIEATHALGVIHRDLKPANIFLVDGSSRPGELRSPVKVLDFGISRPVSGSKKLTRTGLAVGTPRYMPPEQLAGMRDLDPRVDVYTLGVVTFEAITGRLPYRSKNEADLAVEIVRGTPLRLSEVRQDLPARLEPVLAQAMAKARENRYASARELADAFAVAAREAPLSAPHPVVDDLFEDQSQTIARDGGIRVDVETDTTPGPSSGTGRTPSELPAVPTAVVGTFPTRPGTRGDD